MKTGTADGRCAVVRETAKQRAARFQQHALQKQAEEIFPVFREWGIAGVKFGFVQFCNQHWAEVVLGLQTKIAGPVHLGWSVRYKMRLAHKDSSAGNTWYVPGYGKYGGTRIGADFNVIIDI